MRYTILALASLAATTAFAADLSRTDQLFVGDAARANLAEVRLGQLAVQKGTTPAIRNIGQQMIDDHGKVGDKLQAIATREGFTLPAKLSQDQQATYDRLAALNGKDFEASYLEELKSSHQQAISLFQNESQNGTDPQLRSFAQSTLPSLRHHQQMVSGAIKLM